MKQRARLSYRGQQYQTVHDKKQNSTYRLSKPRVDIARNILRLVFHPAASATVHISLKYLDICLSAQHYYQTGDHRRLYPQYIVSESTPALHSQQARSSFCRYTHPPTHSTHTLIFLLCTAHGVRIRQPPFPQWTTSKTLRPKTTATACFERLLS